jgi:hypothetical protein
MFRPTAQSHLRAMDSDYLRERLASGLTLAQIGEECGLHLSTVAYWARKLGLASDGSSRFRQRGEPDRTRLEQLAADGATLHQMATALDRSVSTIRYWLDRWDIGRVRPSARVVDHASVPSVVQRRCHPHGLTDFRLEGRGYYRCLQCRQERVSEWRRRVKRRLVADAGGRCALCGYNQCVGALQFHHRDPGEKTFALSDNGIARNLALAQEEAAKCVLLCANCHAEVENGHTKLQTM